jgi:hypothetical protein
LQRGGSFLAQLGCIRRTHEENKCVLVESHAPIIEPSFTGNTSRLQRLARPTPGNLATK